MDEQSEPQPISSKSGDLVAALEKYLGIPPYTKRVVIDINIATGVPPAVYYEAVGTDGLLGVVEALAPGARIVGVGEPKDCALSYSDEQYSLDQPYCCARCRCPLPESQPPYRGAAGYLCNKCYHETKTVR